MNSVRLSLLTMCTSAVLLAGRAEGALAQATILTVAGTPTPFMITTAVAGSDPTAITNSLMTYFVKAKKPAGAQRIAAQLDSPMPPGTALTLQMSPSAGAISLGPVALDMAPRDIVVNIDKDNGSTLGMTYVFSATAAAGVIPLQSRIVTFTMSNYP